MKVKTAFTTGRGEGGVHFILPGGSAVIPDGIDYLACSSR